MENITLADAWAWVLAAAAAIVALSKAWDVITQRRKPQHEITNELKEIRSMLASDKRRLDEQDKANGVIFRALYAQINHELSGNGDQILRDSRDEIQKYLTNR